MSRYIDADALIEAVEHMNFAQPFMEVARVIYGVTIEIANAPSIDIVRCQDCKYWVYNFNGCSRNPCTEPWLATDFCSYGERRANG